MSKEKQVVETGETRKTFQRQDSPFSMIEEVLNNEGPMRWKNESFHEWLDRIHAVKQIDSVQLTSLYRLHQKLRFDPHGIGEKDMAQMQAGVEQWLRQHAETM